MKLFTTKALKGDLTLTAQDIDGHILRPGNIIKKADGDQLLAMAITQIYKNGKITARLLFTDHTPQGTIYYLGASQRLPATDVIFIKDQA